LETYIRSQEGIEKLAERLEKILGLGKVEARYGLNVGGGHYYRFRCLGFMMLLISNRGEVEIEERKDYDYYLLLAPDDDSINPNTSHLHPELYRLCNYLIIYIGNLLKFHGIDTLNDHIYMTDDDHDHFLGPKYYNPEEGALVYADWTEEMD